MAGSLAPSAIEAIQLESREADPVAPSDKIRLATIGMGGQGFSDTRTALQVPGVEFVAAADCYDGRLTRAREVFGKDLMTTRDYAEILTRSDVDAVIIATPDHWHFKIASEAMRAGKAVWLEKPVGLSVEQVEQVIAAARESGGFLTVGYNRRFSPHSRAVRAAFAGRQGPLAIHYAVAAGPPPAGSWISDPEVGGGRVVGEVCHFVDLCSFLVGATPASVFARALGRDP